MTHDVLEVAGSRVLVTGAGTQLSTVAEVLDLVGDALAVRADWLAVPVDRLAHGFFRLQSGFAGEVLQKLVQYQVGLAVIGDLTEHVAASDAFAGLVCESNRGRHAWFLPDLAALVGRLEPPTRNPVAGPSPHRQG